MGSALWPAVPGQLRSRAAPLQGPGRLRLAALHVRGPGISFQAPRPWSGFVAPQKASRERTCTWQWSLC